MSPPPENPDAGPEILEPDIPELRKKKEEKRGAGLVWRSAGPGSAGGPAADALVAGVGHSKIGFLGQLAGRLAQRLGTNSLLGGLLASRLGPVLLAAAALGFGIVSAVAGIAVFGALGASSGGEANFGFGPAANAPSSMAQLPASPLPARDDPRATRLGVLEEGAAAVPAAPPAEPEKTSEVAAAAPGETPPTEGAPIEASAGPTGLPRLVRAPPLAGAGGSSGGGGFGAAPKTAGALDGVSNANRALTGSARPISQRSAGRVKTAVARSSRSNLSMGQLKFARQLSTQGAKTSSADPAKGFTTSAFEQQASRVGGLPGPIGGGAGGESGGLPNTTVPLGTGAPDIGSTENVTPYQDDLDKAKGNSNAAMALAALGMALIAAGVMMLQAAKKKLALAKTKEAEAEGLSMMAETTRLTAGSLPLAAQLAEIAAQALDQQAAATRAIAKTLEAEAKKLDMMGKASIAAGLAAIMAAMALANQAKDKGKKIKDQFGQKQQGEIVDDCSNQNLADGLARNPEDCNARGFKAPASGLQQAVERESNASFSLGNEEGGPISPAKPLPAAPR